MFYIYQLVTDIFFYGCLYFFQIIVLLICQVIGIEATTGCKIAFLSFVSMLLVFSIISSIAHYAHNKKGASSALFHPVSSLRQRSAYIFTISCTLINLILSAILLMAPQTLWIVTSISHIVSVIGIIVFLISSVFYEALPDKDDTILFEDDALYYYMRVQKDKKSNKFMNSYIIPYDAISRSYVYKNKLYIEYDRNHRGVKVARQFSTHSRCLAIDFKHYPAMKHFVHRSENVIKLKLKQYKNIEDAFYI